ncbi:MAG TPA: hypothetical protein VFP89_10225 [Propionibacteriaceae bacterium]|jgi:hypothetical protein|nr:hypothetical protein [Propionibacteriaceae bacterium]
MTLVLLEAEAEVTRELPIPALAFGLVAFGILVIMLLITMSIGKGRIHT